MKEVLINEYGNTKILGLPHKKPENIFNINFMDGAFVEFLGPLQKTYQIKFINTKTNRVLYENTISNMQFQMTLQSILMKLDKIENDMNHNQSRNMYDISLYILIGMIISFMLYSIVSSMKK